MADHPTGKDIFRKCCSRIAAACAPCGFKYYKSRRSMAKHVGSFTFPAAHCIRFFAYIRLVTFPPAHCIRFFAYIWLVYLPAGTMYSLFRIHSARLPFRLPNVFAFLHTIGSFTFPTAQCIRFFAYIQLVYLPAGTMYSLFRIHLARLPSRWHNVFAFSHTFGSFTFPPAQCIRFFAYIQLVSLPPAQCIRFFAYIQLVYLPCGTMYSLFRIHLARLPSRWHIVFAFSHTFGSFTFPAAHCIRFFAYIQLVYLPAGPMYSLFRIHLARLPSRWHNVFAFSHTFGSFTFPLAHCIRFFAYNRLVYLPAGTLHSLFRIHSARLPSRYSHHHQTRSGLWSVPIYS